MYVAWVDLKQCNGTRNTCYLALRAGDVVESVSGGAWDMGVPSGLPTPSDGSIHTVGEYVYCPGGLRPTD